jgi:transcriptional regulator with XRE-family HTH domain
MNTDPSRIRLLDDIGGRIAYFRRMKGWLQKQLGAEAGIKPSRMSKLEHGRAEPSFRELQRLALLLGQPLERFDTLRVHDLPGADAPEGTAG